MLSAGGCREAFRCCDSLLDDADWLKRYASNAAGEPVPDELINREGFSARYLADACNQSVDEVWREAQQLIAAAAQRGYPAADRTAAPHALDARIRIVHGAEVLADNSTSDAAMCRQFEDWVGRHYG